jgi:hypothetical protein
VPPFLFVRLTDSPTRKDNGTNLLQDNVAPGVTGKIMGAPPAGAMIEAACDYAILGRSSATISPSA